MTFSFHIWDHKLGYKQVSSILRKVYARQCKGLSIGLFLLLHIWPKFLFCWQWEFFIRSIGICVWSFIGRVVTIRVLTLILQNEHTQGWNVCPVAELSCWEWVPCLNVKHVTLFSMRTQEMNESAWFEYTWTHGLSRQKAEMGGWVACYIFFASRANFCVGYALSLNFCADKPRCARFGYAPTLALFLAVQNSSIGDLVTHSLTQSVTVLLLLTHK